jgi:hypothetical protein
MQNGTVIPYKTPLDLSLPLSSALVKLATTPFPDTFLFREVLRSADALDETDLPLWDTDPPYQQPQPVDSEEEAQFTRNLIDVMSGRRMRLEKEAKRCRTARYIWRMSTALLRNFGKPLRVRMDSGCHSVIALRSALPEDTGR